MAKSGYSNLETAARAYGETNGFQSNSGGWILRDGDAKPLIQGWWAFGDHLLRAGFLREKGDRYFVVDGRFPKDLPTVEELAIQELLG